MQALIILDVMQKLNPITVLLCIEKQETKNNFIQHFLKLFCCSQSLLLTKPKLHNLFRPVENSIEQYFAVHIVQFW